MREQNLKKVLVAFATLLILAFNLPYQVYPYLNFYHDWLAFFSLAILLGYFASTYENILRLPWITWPLIALIALIGFQTLFGKIVFWGDAALSGLYVAGAIVSILIGATASVKLEAKEYFLIALGFVFWGAGLLSCVSVTLQVLGWERSFQPFVMPVPHSGQLRPYANLGQPNQLALLFCLGIASSWFLRRLGKINLLVAVISAIALIWGLSLTQSRIGWILMPLFAVLSGIHQTKSSSLTSPWISIFWVSLYFTLVFVLPEIDFHVNDEQSNQLFSVSERVNSVSDRIVLFMQALSISNLHPWFGVGWLQFGPAQIGIAGNFPPSIYSNHSHNIVLNFVSETGWPFALVFFAVVGYWIYCCCFLPIRQNRSTTDHLYLVLLLVAISIHSLVEYPLWYGYILVPTGLVIGVLHQSELGSMEIRFSRYGFMFLFSVLIAALLLVAKDYRTLVNNQRIMGWESLGLRAEEGTFSRPERTLFNHFYEYFTLKTIKAKTGMTREEIQYLEAVSERFGNPLSMVRLSFAYALNGRKQDAINILRSLSRLYPGQYSKAYGDWQLMSSQDPYYFAEIFRAIPDLQNGAELPQIKSNPRVQ